MENETYLGDGLYASYDGYQFKLRAPRLGGAEEVFLDDRVLTEFFNFIERTKQVHISIVSVAGGPDISSDDEFMRAEV